MNDLFEF